MFKKTRRKIVGLIMIIVVLLWVGMLAVIYGSSYLDVTQQNRQMLETHAAMYRLSKTQDVPPPTNLPHPEFQTPEADPVFQDAPAFQLATFYTVAFSYEGDVLEVQNEKATLHTDADLEQSARKILQSEQQTGIEKSLMYYVTDKGGYLLVSFMDNTVIAQSATTLFRYTLLFGAIAIVLLFFVSAFLAKKILHPLEENDRKQKQFISDAGHELKTPVAVVSANAELLSRQLGENQWLANIQYENERMGKLIGQLLILARTEQVASQFSKVDLSQLVYGESLPFESVAYERGLCLQMEIQEGIWMEADSAQIKQLVSILVDNGIRHSSQHSQIEPLQDQELLYTVQVRLLKENSRIYLSIINPGEAIASEQLEHIFERFYRLDFARNEEMGHYGLGLAIAKNIVHSHKGKIQVFCQDGRVEFRVVFPTIQ